MTEVNLIQKAREKLIEIGFKSSEIFSEYSFNNRYRVDIVVFDNGKPYLIVEVKKSEEFNNNLDYKFDPVVRQAQTYAKNLPPLVQASSSSPQRKPITMGDPYFNQKHPHSTLLTSNSTLLGSTSNL